MARSIEAAASGMPPDCQARPSMNMLAAMASPSSAVAVAVASMLRVSAAPARPVMVAISFRVGRT